MLREAEALAVVASLEPCPFCGSALTPSLRGSKGIFINPRANCKTVDCWGARLPVLSLDVPQDVAAWNKRAARPQGEKK